MSLNYALESLDRNVKGTTGYIQATLQLAATRITLQSGKHTYHVLKKETCNITT